MKELQLQHNAVIKAVETTKEGILIIKGIASMYRTPEGFLQVDRDNELVNLDFMDLDSYKKNPVLCFQHDWAKGVGKVVDIEHKDGALHITAEVHRLTGLEHIYEGVQKGIIKSLSVGTIPHGYSYHDTHDGDILEIASSTLVEISLTTVQSNQEALFDVVAEKSPTISRKTLASQNGMTCDELDGSCAFKAELVTQKEVSMNKVNKEPEVKPEPTPEPEVKAEPEVKPEVKPEPEVKAEPAPVVLDESSIVEAIANAQIKADELKDKRIEEAAQAAKEATEQAAKEAQAQIDNAVDYIKEKTKIFTDTPDVDLDTSAIEDFYELISDSVEAIETKIANVIKAAI